MTVRIPLGPQSVARLRIMDSTAALAVADGTMKARPCQAEVVSIERIVPRCLPSIHRFPAASVQ